ncbi:MAG TPA: diphthine synthase [Candidatus Thermoplasmatota archaeon]|nr:diphthine synthase [Candidatus Thermoplasmatota archaeon]
MALHLVGLGLHDVRGVSVRGMELARAADAVYAEFYTATLAGADAAGLEAFFGRPVTLLDRLGVEKGAPRLVEEARRREVVLLVAGDPLAATTHTDLVLRARAAGVAVHVVHGASILTAAPGLLGLQHYKFGRTTTLARPAPGWSPTSPFDAVAENHARKLHTLVLLDIQADAGYFMAAGEGLGILLDLAKRTGNTWFGPPSQVGIVARAGSDRPLAVTGTVERLQHHDAGPPLHTLVVPGEFHEVELEAWRSLAADRKA